MNNILSTVLLLITFINIQAQVTVLSEQTYDSGALYGYMNGGSELFKEYGFKKLTVQQLKVNDEEIKVEQYEMASALLAFGIYSVNVYKCEPCGHIHHKPICCSPYQLQAVIGSNYFSIINNNGSSASKNAALTVLKEFINKNNTKNSKLLPKHIIALNADKLMYINGRLAMENRGSAWLDAYDKLGIQSCYIAQWKEGQTSLLVFDSDKKINTLSIKDYILKKRNGKFYLARKDADNNFQKQILDTL